MSVHPQDIYDFAVTNAHATGDLWAGLSCLGLLGTEAISGIVISPACDLSNRKVETITYLPVVPVARFIISPGYRPTILRKVNGLLEQLNIEKLATNDSFLPVESSELERVRNQINDRATHDQSKKVAETALRLTAGVSLLGRDVPGVGGNALLKFFAELMGSKAEEEARNLIMNSLRNDIHFLPNDRQSDLFSAVPAHSVVLFRYPITMPVGLLDDAAVVPENGWRARCHEVALRFPIALNFSEHLPQKRSRVRIDFMADLLTRYTALYLRIGSPDFHEREINKFTIDLIA